MNKQMLSEVVDYEDGVRRFSGNEALFTKFLLKFLKDSNYSQMKLSLEQGDYEAAFKFGHALKGIAGNLSLKPLYGDTCVLVDELRANKLDNLEPLLAVVTRDYEKTFAAIDKSR